MTAALEVQSLCRSFDGIVVADNISLSLAAGDRVALIGPNGAGKTTFVNLVTGTLKPDAGRILLAGVDVTTVSDVERVRRGLVRTFQITRLFPDMTVHEHLMLALLQRAEKTGRLFASLDSFKDAGAEADDLIAQLGLAPVADVKVRALAYGHQRLVEIAIAVALKPKVLLLDEPAAGIPHDEVLRIIEALERLPADLAILMIEHDMDLVFRFAERVIVLAAGKIVCQGTPEEVGRDPAVRAVYLGSYASRDRDALGPGPTVGRGRA